MDAPDAPLTSVDKQSANYDHWALCVTLTFELWTWYTCSNHCTIEATFAKLFKNPPIHGQVTAWTSKEPILTFINNFDVWATNLVHMHKTPFDWGKHLCQVI